MLELKEILSLSTIPKIIECFDISNHDGVVRHPQYTGIFLAIIGQLIHWPTIPTVVLFPVIVWAYYRLAKREEQQMLEKFGTAYVIYCQHVPMFIPRGKDWKHFLSPRDFSEEEI